MINADSSHQSITPAQTNIDTATIDIPPETQLQKKLQLIHFYLMKGLTILLILQGLWTLFNSIKFIFIDLHSLESQLALKQISSSQINLFANKAIVMTISTILSLFFALRITVAQSKLTQAISTIIAILLIIGNAQINSFLNQIDSSQLITSTIVATFKSILSF